MSKRRCVKLIIVVALVVVGVGRCLEVVERWPRLKGLDCGAAVGRSNNALPYDASFLVVAPTLARAH